VSSKSPGIVTGIRRRKETEEVKSAKNRAKYVKAGALFLSAVAALAIRIPPASAADYGVGVAHDGGGTTVLFPIRLDSLTVEPEVSFSRSKSDSETSTASGKETVSSYGFATGIYTRRELGPSFEGYFGGRVGIGKSRDHGDQGTSTFQQKNDTWFVAPTAGLQHYFSQQFGISLEVGLVYEHGKNSLSFGTDQSTTASQVSTRTRILLRGYF
jgi:hypothetical protein